MNRHARSRHRILMCPPDFFSVDHAINPWMAGNEGKLDQRLAMEQWTRLRDAVAQVADIELMDPLPDLPDLVFTANAGVVYGNKAVPSHFMPKERRPEEPYLEQWFIDHGFEVYGLPDDIGFEGAGDCLRDRGGPWLWTGYGFRTEIEAHALLADWLGAEVVSIKLTDSRFYHIDTCFCPLAGGYLMYFPGGFDRQSLQKIESRIPADKRIAVDGADAANFACNAINIDEHLFLHRASEDLRNRLAKHGFVVHEIELSEFLKSGGSAKCLSLRLTEPVG